jgi:hypothetical protein
VLGDDDRPSILAETPQHAPGVRLEVADGQDVLGYEKAFDMSLSPG